MAEPLGQADKRHDGRRHMHKLVNARSSEVNGPGVGVGFWGMDRTGTAPERKREFS